MSGSRFDYDLHSKISEIYAEANAKIMRELGRDAVMCALRDVKRIRLEAFEKVIAEARAESPSNRDALNRSSEIRNDKRHDQPVAPPQAAEKFHRRLFALAG